MVEEAVRSRGFEIIEKKGTADFRVVYQACWPSSGHDVAVKVILPDIAGYSSSSGALRMGHTSRLNSNTPDSSHSTNTRGTRNGFTLSCAG
ncbi:MAG: hypothetical protein WA996_02685 [Candidatus Promineifilaceae bacterium]